MYITSHSDHLKIHLKSHDVRESRRCPICDRGFGGASALAAHLRKHGETSTSASKGPSPSSSGSAMVCVYCGVEFSDADTLYQHIRSQHSSEAGLELGRKRKAESLDNGLSERRKPEANGPYDKPCICSRCYAQMPNFESFLAHMENHVSSGAAGRCPACGDPCRDRAELSEHLYSHAVSDVPGRRCRGCEKIFDDADQLEAHLLEVHSHVLYECGVCGESFNSRSDLRVSHYTSKVLQ